MDAFVSCPKCGETLSVEDTVCPRCGTPVTGSPPAAPAVGGWPPPPPPEGPVYPAMGAPPEMSYERRRAIDRTKTGIALLAIAAALLWIPVVSLLGDLLILIGGILVILGAGPFGAAHERNVWIAAVLYIIGLLGVFGLAASVMGQIETATNLPAAQVEGAVVAAFNTLFVGGVIVGLFSGIGSVLFLYALMNIRGKVLLWASFVASFAVLAVAWVVVMPQVGPATAAAYAVSPPDPGPILALDAQVNALKLLNLIPDLLLAAAGFVAWSRIDQGEIPAPSSMPAPTS